MPSLFRQIMELGSVQLNNGPLKEAIRTFHNAKEAATNPFEIVEAAQMLCASYRKYGNIQDSVKFGGIAYRDAVAIGGAHNLVSGTARDLASTRHALAVLSRKNRTANLYEASRLYEIALKEAELANGTQQRTDEYWVALGMQGLLWFDMSHYGWAPYGEGISAYFDRLDTSEREILARDARAMLEEADSKLRDSDKQDWKLNTLLKRIQVETVEERLALKSRAYNYAMPFPSRRKEVPMALAGRRFMRLALIGEVWLRKVRR